MAQVHLHTINGGGGQYQHVWNSCREGGQGLTEYCSTDAFMYTAFPGTCCNPPDLPWFNRMIKPPSTADIELRLRHDQGR